MFFRLALCLLLSGLIALPATAMTLDQAKDAGLIGEQANGYVGLVKPNVSSDVRNQLQQTNQKRQTYYQSLAKKNNMNLTTIESLAGKKLIDRSPPGHYIRSNGGWVKK